MNAFDLTVFHWFNGLAGKNAVFDRMVICFTDYAPVFFGVLFVILFFRRSRESHLLRKTIVLAGLSGVLGLVIAAAIASMVYRPRPFVVLLHQARLLLPHAADSSFPSDHATGSAAFAAGMWRAPGTPIRWVFAIAAVMVGVSRLIVGVHWPSDILGSFFLGYLSAQSVWALSKPLSAPIERIISIYDRAEARFTGDR